MKTFLYNWVAGFILGFSMVKFLSLRLIFVSCLGIATIWLAYFTWLYMKRAGIRL